MHADHPQHAIDRKRIRKRIRKRDGTRIVDCVVAEIELRRAEQYNRKLEAADKSASHPPHSTANRPPI